jgi:amino acid transporter
MSAQHASLSHHPAPHRDRVSQLTALFGVAGGPLAWFVEVCAGFALASAPCFSSAVRTTQPVAQLTWAWPAMIAVMVACVLTALIACAVSYRTFARTRAEAQGDPAHLMEVGAGRTRFVALWGVLLGAGFAIAAAATAIAFVAIPRCAG